MYEALVARVRYHIQKANFMGLKEAESTLLLGEAADAIEGLQKDLERSKEYEAFWEKEANEALRKFQVAIASKPRWIPVTERLPDNEDEVVVAFKNSADGEWWYRIDNFVDGAFCYNAAFGRNITHWMPLPTPPKEEAT